MSFANQTIRPGHSAPSPCSRAPRGPLTAVKTSFPKGFRSHWHCTDRGQLIYPGRGVMTISTETGSWVVPPTQACWLPASVGHAVETVTGLEMHSVYCERLVERLPQVCVILPVAPLLRELILTLSQMPPDLPGRTPGEKMDAWLTGQLTPQGLSLPQLPVPTSRPLRSIVEALELDPANSLTLTNWAQLLATTPRSLSRAFARELQMPFTEYRRQLRLRAALLKLGQGQAVTTVALDLGFSSASNFITMFRRSTGVTPRAVFGRIDHKS